MTKEERNKYNYNLTHRIIDGVEYKKCSHHLKNFPEEEEWMVCSLEYFYKSKNSKSDGLLPECKKCSSKRSWDYQLDNWDEYYGKVQKLKKENIESYRDYHREYRHVRKDLYDARRERFYKNHPEKYREYGDRHSSKDHKISIKEWRSCKAYFKNTCAYCGLAIEDHYFTRKGVTKNGDFHKEHKDHNGSNDLSNCLPSCKNCNSLKWAFPFEEWYNDKNPVFSQERLNKIMQWLDGDYKKYIVEKIEATL